MLSQHEQGYRRWQQLAMVAASSIAAACGGSPSSPTSTALPVSASNASSLSAIQTQIFTPKCSGCHGHVVAQAGLNLAEGVSFASLVDVPSSQTSKFLVVPEKPDESYLLDKIKGTASIVGGRMPQGGPFLTSVEIDSIRQWISTGALSN